jgi:hypothetical protein
LKLYENVVIGNFLYALGYVLGKKTKGDAILPAVNLLQQTPDDKRLADVFMASKTAILILEFKRQENTDDKEELKLKSLKRAVRHKNRMQEISKLTHWFIESSVPGDQLFTRIQPYLLSYQKDIKNISLPDFLGNTADTLLNGIQNVSCQEITQYLGLLTTCNGGLKRATKKTGKKTTSGGTDTNEAKERTPPQSSSLILQVTKDGSLSYAHIASYEDISQTRRKLFHELEHKMLIAQKIEYAYQQEQYGPLQQNTPVKAVQTKEYTNNDLERTL